MTEKSESGEAIRAGEAVNLDAPSEPLLIDGWTPRYILDEAISMVSQAGNRDLANRLGELHNRIEGKTLFASRASAPTAEQPMTKTYPCGCSATGAQNIPNYCPEHGLTPHELIAAALLCERWWHEAFKKIDRVMVSLPDGCDWITMQPDLLESLVSKLRAAALSSPSPADPQR